MNTATLPRVAIDLGDGLPWYPFRTGMDGAILFTDKPELPAPSFYWVTLRGDERPRVELDTVNIADLLFCSTLNTDAELSDDEIRAAVDETLATYRCHIDRCKTRHETEAGDYPTETAHRYAWCVICAARLLGVEP